MARRVALCWLLVVIAWCRSPLWSAEPVQHLVIVSIDGLGASYLDDQRAELPMLRELASTGARAQGVISTFPSNTWPSHTSMITGVPPNRHGVIANNVFDRKLNRIVTYIGDPELTKEQAIRVPTLYDVAHHAGLRTGAVIWPCCNGATSMDYMIPDTNKPELHARYTTPGMAEELLSAGIDIRPIAEWGWDKQKANERDQLYMDVGCFLVENKRVNLMLIHLITPDGVEHDHGPHTPPAFEAAAASDRRVRQIWEILNRPPLAGKSTLFVVSDHGFAPYEKRIYPNVLLRRLGMLDVDANNQVTDRRAWCIAQGGCSFVYVLGDQNHAERVKSLRMAFQEVEGVQHIVGPDEFPKWNVPLPRGNVQAPDFILTTGPGYAFNDNVDGELLNDAGGLRGSHGHLPEPDYMHAMFIAAGAGVKSNVKLGVINNIDIGPTAGKLLGLTIPHAEGRVLHEILEE